MNELKKRQELEKVASARLKLLKMLGGEPAIGDFRKIIKTLFPLILGGTAGAMGYKHRDWLKKHIWPKTESAGDYLGGKSKEALIKAYLMFQEDVPDPLKNADPRTLLSLPRLPE